MTLVLLGACSRIEPLADGDLCRRTVVLDQGLLPEHVQWTEAEDEGDRYALDLQCEAVGSALLLAKPPQSDTGKAQADSIAVVSWNTHVGGGDIERFVRELRAGRFTGGDSVRHFVMLLQEVYRSSDSVPAKVRVETPNQIAVNPPSGERRDILASATTLGLSLLYVPSMRNGASVPEDRGNAILSTLPLKNPRALELPFERQRRVVAFAEVEAQQSDGNDWSIDVASVHLDNRSRVTYIGNSVGRGRLRQAAAIIEHLGDTEPAVVAGDLNTWAADFVERAIPRLREAFPDTPEPPEGITYVKGNMRRRIDYMFFRLPDDWRGGYKRIASRYGSDHHPLLGWVVPKGGRPATRPAPATLPLQ